jgi:hypothetical protein
MVSTLDTWNCGASVNYTRTVTYDFGSGEEVCDLMFSGNVDSGHYSIIKLSHNLQGVKSTKRKRKGKKSLTERKETTRTTKK